MITFQVIDRSPASFSMYSMHTGARTLTIADDYKIEKHKGGLKVIESGRVHLFDKEGCYIGTEFCSK